VVPAVNVDWSIVAERIISPDREFWRALITTVTIAIIAQLLGIALGLVSALAGLSRLRAVRALSAAYVLIIRGTPLIVQIFFIYFGANLLFGFTLFPRQVAIAGLVISGAILAGTAALAINEGSYMSEIIRAGIQSVDPGQMEAALSVGMTRSLAMRRIVLPQAARVIVPPLGNEFNGMIKNTSLLAFIGVYELFYDAEVHYTTTFKPVEYFLAVAFWYLVLTTIWSLIQARIERHLNPAEQEQEEETGVIARVRRLQWGRAH
jgi:polar amino acid transport system permease protein